MDFFSLEIRQGNILFEIALRKCLKALRASKYLINDVERPFSRWILPPEVNGHESPVFESLFRFVFRANRQKLADGAYRK